MGAFLLEVHTMRGLACRELARLQDLIEEAGVRRPEEPSLDLADFKVQYRKFLLESWSSLVRVDYTSTSLWP